MIVKKESVEMEFSFSNVFKTGGKLESILTEFKNEKARNSAGEIQKCDT